MHETNVSVYCTTNNLKTLQCNSFKISAYFKEQKLKNTMPSIFLKSFCFKVFVFSVSFSKGIKT